ncbi:alpha-crystallin domain-containing protein 22.3-like, partial [Capsicum annuum]
SSPSSMLNSGEANSSIPLYPQLFNMIPLSCNMLGSACNNFFSACLAREERDDLINHTNGGVALTGSALLGKFGPLIGSADIAES